MQGEFKHFRKRKSEIQTISYYSYFLKMERRMKIVLLVNYDNVWKSMQSQ